MQYLYKLENGERFMFKRVVWLEKCFQNHILLTLTYQKASIHQGNDAYTFKSAFQLYEKYKWTRWNRWLDEIDASKKKIP